MSYNAGDARACYTHERIYLRALLITYADGSIQPGVALPDGRFIFGTENNITTYSSEKVLIHLNPGARIMWTPDTDATINHVMEDEGL